MSRLDRNMEGRESAGILEIDQLSHLVDFCDPMKRDKLVLPDKVVKA